MKIKVYAYGDSPEVEFEEGGNLYGFDFETPPSLPESRIKPLYDAIEADVGDYEYVVGQHEDGRLAITGLTIKGYQFAIEK